ncbi:sensor domain-containing diguanylate cyclase [Bacillus sp. DTU_2020_1000418_1_SI_GHA_SEK_038]|uniref:sensor domain-containing diguanylate cyclase n=1 Tax=Bacillus sp. DTU_2020_1000418_1_SI_GHA_SEK_038 TaxID=3077585 RepID=UPI0028E68218|nr:sensor domain-containing diguanylate cyclase [Bacillus sp. DTU_2020_1000418_1_SI_GHA_SEK_038]WNS76198.1 sensor domain-containing diguanylate cyclase [Bacillus sp. DTU_2020_1000418_1_SI_GHA_SEK_038]
MKKFKIRMKIIFVLITCMSLFDILDEKVLMFFHLKGDGFWKVLIDTGSSLVVLSSVLWAFLLGKKIILNYKEKEKHYRNLIDLSPEAIFVHRNGKILFTNKAGVTLLGANSEDDLLNHNWKNYIQSSSSDWDHLKEKVKYYNGGILTFQIRVKRLDGQVIDLEITSTNIEYDGLPAREFIARDITLRKKQESMIKKLAYQDTLTGLPNRRAVLDSLEQLIKDSEKNKTHFAVFFIDLDGFKKVNDSLGHDTGDELLKRVSVLLKSCVRGNDIVARFAGDEFMILLPKANKQYCSIIADKIIGSLDSPIYIMGKEIHVTPSIGISLYPQNGEEATALIKMADEAMYQAKNNGKNSYQFVEESSDLPERRI